MASTRLRRAFQYPTDEDDLSTAPDEGIDEEEQEKIITNLQSHDESQTTFYTTAFLTLPLSAILVYLISIFRPSSPSSFISALLAISSLLASAYILYFLPLVGAEERRANSGLRLGKWMKDENGPVNTYIVPLNGALAALLGLRGYAEGRKSGWVESEGLLGVVPLVIYLLILMVRWQLKPIDIEGLEKMRYRYKGA